MDEEAHSPLHIYLTFFLSVPVQMTCADAEVRSQDWELHIGDKGYLESVINLPTFARQQISAHDPNYCPQATACSKFKRGCTLKSRCTPLLMCNKSKFAYSAAASGLASSATGAPATASAALALFLERRVRVVFLAALSFAIFSL